MNYNELKQLTFELIDKLSGSKIESISIEFEQAKICLSQKGGTVFEGTAQEHAASAPVKQKTIAAPMVGTFYAAPSPDSEPFVKVGDKICEGDTICIIEAMKLMNEIAADKSGIIKEILVNNGEVVEYNQPLMIIE